MTPSELRRAHYTIIGEAFTFPLVVGKLHTIYADLCVLDGNTCQPKPTPAASSSAPATIPVYAIPLPETGDDPWLDLSATWWEKLTLEEQGAQTGNATGVEIPHPKGLLSSLDPDQLQDRVVWRLTQPANRPELLTTDAATIAPDPFSRVVPHAKLNVAEPGLYEVELAITGDDGDRLVVDKARFLVFTVDLDIDSDNDDAFHVDFERNAEEEALEDDPAQPGKILIINTWDQDNDGIPNFADGMLTSRFDTRSTPAGGPLTPVILELLPEGVDWQNARIRFHYDASDPNAMMRDEHGTPGDLSDDTYTLQDTGHLRLWTKDGNMDRQAATDYLESDKAYNVSDLLAGDGHTIQLYLEGTRPTSALQDRQIMVEIDPSDDGLPGVVAQDRLLITVQKATIEVYKQPSNAYEPILVKWPDVILWDDWILVKITLASPITSLEEFPKTLEARVFSVDTEANWQILPVIVGFNTERIINAKGQSEIWIILRRLDLATHNLIPQDLANDGLSEFASLDWIEDPSKSNHRDSDQFDALMQAGGYTQRGKARGIEAVKNGDPSTLESPVDQTFLKAGGVQFIQFRVPETGGIEGEYLQSTPRQIQNQANYLYYSGHGRHSTGELLSGGNLTPTEAAHYWQHQELHTVIFAGCSVLDIKDYSGYWKARLLRPPWDDTDPLAPFQSPGEKWEKTGPKLFLGYAGTAPLDTTSNDPSNSQNNDLDATAKIIQLWFTKGMDAQAWMEANQQITNMQGTQIGVNACAIDLTRPIWTYYFFKWKAILTRDPTNKSFKFRRKYQIEIIHAVRSPWDEWQQWPESPSSSLRYSPLSRQKTRNVKVFF